MFTTKTMRKYYYGIFLFICGCTFINSDLNAQNYPYPKSPGNTNFINTQAPTLQWKGSTNFTRYKIEIFDCNYNPGDNFNSIKLEDYTISQFISGDAGYETSALTNHEMRTNDHITVDDEGTKIRSYSNTFGVDGWVNINYAGSDFEGLTYLYDDYFVMVEERLDQLIFMQFNYTANGLVSSISTKATRNLNNPFITGQNDGYEGVTYNPISGKMYMIKEYNDMKIFECTAPTAPNFNQSINLTEPFNLEQVYWAPDDVAGLYHLSLNQPFSATPAGEHILLLSQESNIIYEIDLNGALISQMQFDLGGILGSYTNGFFQPEGITYEDGMIWISSEGKGSKTAKYFGFENFDHENPVIVNNSIIYSKTNLNATQHTLPSCTLEAGKEYCWKVTGYLSNGQTRTSEYYSFTVQNNASTCNSCPTDIYHIQGATQVNSQSYVASNNIQSNINAGNLNNLHYYAGSEVYLKNGFYVSENCNFSANIDGCN